MVSLSSLQSFNPMKLRPFESSNLRTVCCLHPTISFCLPSTRRPGIGKYCLSVRIMAWPSSNYRALKPHRPKRSSCVIRLDLLKLKLSPNDKVLIKFVAADRKGTYPSRNPLSCRSFQDLDLSATQVLNGITMVNDLGIFPIQRNPLQAADLQSFKERLVRTCSPTSGNCPFDERGGRPSYEKSLTILPAMPRGAISK